MADAFAGIARSLCSLEDDGTTTRAVCLKQMGGGTTKKDDRLVEVVNVVSVPIETTTERTTTPSSAPWGHYCVVKAPPGSPKSSRRSSSSRPSRYWKNSSWLSSHRTKRIRSSRHLNHTLLSSEYSVDPCRLETTYTSEFISLCEMIAELQRTLPAVVSTLKKMTRACNYASKCRRPVLASLPVTSSQNQSLASA